MVQDVKHRGLDTSLFDAGIFVPYAQRRFGNAVSFTLRTSGDPMALASAVRALVGELDKDQPIAKLRPMEKVLGASIAQPRFRTLLLGIFGAMAVLLAAVGLYGVLAYTVAQRTHEIGIRMALGAQMGNVLALILRNGMAMALIGIGIGLAGALMLTRVLSGFLYQLEATDPITFVAVSLLLAGIAFLGCWLPAWRAARVNPMEALRYE